MAKRAFVTGSTGFLGITLCDQLVRTGWDVVAFHRPSSDLTELARLPSVRFAAGDVTDGVSVLSAMPECPDAVFHCAASVGFLNPGQAEQQYAVNVLGTRNVIHAARQRRSQRFIHTSTVLTYDFLSGARVHEDSPRSSLPNVSYIHTKQLADQEVDNATRQGLDAVTLHPCAIFGAHDKATWSKIFTVMQRGLRIPISPPGAASVCHMREVARAHLSAFERGRRGEHYILGGPDHSIFEIMSAIAELLERPGPTYAPAAWLTRSLLALDRWTAHALGQSPMTTAAEASILCQKVLCSSDKAARELGYQPADLGTMLGDCHQWMASDGMLG